VQWLFHSTAIVPDYDNACARLERLAGLRVLECDSAPDIGRRGGMTWIGDNALEIGEPLGPVTAPARFVKDHGGGVHSIALEVADLEATISHLEARGVRVAARPRPGFCFSDPRDTRGVFIQWSHFVVDADPRHGAALPDHVEEPVLEVTRHAYVGAVVEDPIDTARFLADLMGTSVTFEAPAAPTGRPRAGVSLGDCTLALFPLPGPGEPEIWGRIYGRARTNLLALAVADLERAAAAAARDGFGILRREHDMAVLDPRTTGDVQIALVGGLLPGDPRS
jgi:methylmalonyl-CoA/ethylmalonyl-CoA epimerase